VEPHKKKRKGGLQRLQEGARQGVGEKKMLRRQGRSQGKTKVKQRGLQNGTTNGLQPKKTRPKGTDHKTKRG